MVLEAVLFRVLTLYAISYQKVTPLKALHIAKIFPNDGLNVCQV
jgi:hypothetical protein